MQADITSLSSHTHPLSSSKKLKKNILPLEDYNLALKDIIDMPLPTYQYKDSHPNHTRRGFIAEDLPAHMKLQPEKGSDLVKPNWASICGSFWASLKALAIKFDNLKEEMSKKWAEFTESMSNLKNSLADLTRNFSLFQSKMTKLSSELKAENTKLKRELAETRQEITEIKAMLKKPKGQQAEEITKK